MAKLKQLYPDITSVYKPASLSRGKFDGGEAIGAVISTTGDRNYLRVLDAAANRGEGYHLVIDRNGDVHQSAYLTDRINHAGKSYWHGNTPNRTHLAIGLVSWGRVFPKYGNRWVSLTGANVRNSDVSLRPSNADQGNYHWDACTAAQESTLIDVLAWLGGHGISPAMICGLDECAMPIGRELSPGGSLSMSMPQLRTWMRMIVAKQDLALAKP